MTHPTPTATTRASPPPRGQGLGVGVRPSTKPRPGPEPGPRPTQRATRAVPGQARVGVLTLTLLLATQATAQIIPTGTPTADILMSQSIAEHRIYLTCSALDPVTHAQIMQNWQRDVTDAAAILTANAIPPEVITAFQTAARPDNLLPATDTPFDAVRQLCNGNPDWQADYARLNVTVLALQLPQAFP